MDQRAEELANRAVVALEKLAEEPEFEIPTSPPLCPHCGTHDPEVLSQDNSGQGQMSKMFLRLTCMTCHEDFLVVPQGWVNFTDQDELKEFLERAEDGNSGQAS